LGGTTAVDTLSLAGQSHPTASTHTSATWTPEDHLQEVSPGTIEDVITTLQALVLILKVVEPTHPWTEEELLQAAGVNLNH
jgi:hypothetical protein